MQFYRTDKKIRELHVFLVEVVKLVELGKGAANKKLSYQLDFSKVSH
jgi:hypothetical protein